MSNLLDLNPILNERQSQAYIDHIFYMSENAHTPKDRLFYAELKLAYQFDLYYSLNGVHHDSDPANLDDCGVNNEL